MGLHPQDGRSSETSPAVAHRAESPSRPGRAAGRVLILFLTLVEIAGRFAVLRLRRGPRMQLRDRAEWLHHSCGLILRRMGIRTDFRGPRPTRGLICANHLSYLDIAVCAAAAPCVFVSKREVKSWPAFGFFARCAGTIFLDRRSRTSADAAAAEMGETMESGVPVLLFPEGTSTDGSEVLRFHPTLLEPAIQKGLEIAPAAIAYRLRGGEEREVCYYGGISFVRHLLRTLGRADMAAEVEFYPDPAVYEDRHSAALDAHDKVEAMRRRMMHDSIDELTGAGSLRSTDY
jgi:1-acyl-sn-glycerol-3-phosphate acyltransferase